MSDFWVSRMNNMKAANGLLNGSVNLQTTL
jgi:hypothetical protein